MKPNFKNISVAEIKVPAGDVCTAEQENRKTQTEQLLLQIKSSCLRVFVFTLKKNKNMKPNFKNINIAEIEASTSSAYTAEQENCQTQTEQLLLQIKSSCLRVFVPSCLH